MNIKAQASAIAEAVAVVLAVEHCPTSCAEIARALGAGAERVAASLCSSDLGADGEIIMPVLAPADPRYHGRPIIPLTAKLVLTRRGREVYEVLSSLLTSVQAAEPKGGPKGGGS